MSLWRRTTGARGVSLRRRLIVRMLVLLTAGLIASGATTYVVLQALLVNRVATAVVATARAAATTIDALGSDSSPSDAITRERLTAALTPMMGNDEALLWESSGGSRLLIGAPRSLLVTGRASADVGMLITHLTHTVEEPGYVDAIGVASGHSIAGTSYQTTIQPTNTGRLVLAAPLSDVDHTLSLLLIIELLVGGGLLIVMTGLGALVIRRGLRPLATIARTAAAITDGDRSLRISLSRADSEVTRVATALNQMLTETEASFEANTASEKRLRQFVADASHELRTPLASVRSYAELLRTGAARTTQDRTLAVERIESESARMSELVEDLLLLARLDSGRPMRADEVDLATLVGDVVRDENVIDPRRERRLRVTGRTSVCGDAQRLRQVVTNLLGNIRAHTPPSTSVDVILSGPDEEPGQAKGKVRLTIADHGHGLTDEQAAHVFERFYRADKARTRHVDSGTGVGLGLSIVAAIVAAHDGTVHVTETPGGGATFTVHLPVAPARQQH
jgi:two-component system OmpR family sensor kinase